MVCPACTSRRSLVGGSGGGGVVLCCGGVVVVCAIFLTSSNSHAAQYQSFFPGFVSLLGVHGIDGGTRSKQGILEGLRFSWIDLRAHRQQTPRRSLYLRAPSSASASSGSIETPRLPDGLIQGTVDRTAVGRARAASAYVSIHGRVDADVIASSGLQVLGSLAKGGDPPIGFVG